MSTVDGPTLHTQARLISSHCCAGPLENLTDIIRQNLLFTLLSTGNRCTEGALVYFVAARCPPLCTAMPHHRATIHTMYFPRNCMMREGKKITVKNHADAKGRHHDVAGGLPQMHMHWAACQNPHRECAVKACMRCRAHRPCRQLRCDGCRTTGQHKWARSPPFFR